MPRGRTVTPGAESAKFNEVPPQTTVSGFRRSVMTTTAANLASTAAAGVTGILIARSLGPTDRGIYAAIMAWFGLLLVIGEMGQTAATTYFVARDREQARDYVATSRRLMTFTGLVTLGAGLLCAPLLAGDSGTAEDGYRLMFATCIFSFVGASLIFSLQALYTTTWNLIRVFQPLAFAAIVWALFFTDSLTVLTCLVATSFTLLAQTCIAYFACRRNGLAGGHARRDLTSRMTRYGLAQVASAAPAVIVSRLDVLVLSLVVEPASVGHYAVAVSFTGLALPLVSGIGAVVFPRIALNRGRDVGEGRRLEQRSIALTAVISGAAAIGLMACAPWVVPLMFGRQFRESVPLVFVLAPAVAALACSQVCGDILRGRGRPFTVAKVQWAAALVTVAGIAVLLPTFGVVGAAVAATLSACASLTFSVISLRRVRRQADHPDYEPPH